MDAKLCAIVPAMNVEKSISNTLRQLNRAGIRETIVVCNGCEDDTITEIRKTRKDLNTAVEFVEIKVPLGHDVPRAYGALLAKRKRCFSHILIIDGDWSGSYGPMLETYIEECIEKELDIMWTPVKNQIQEDVEYLTPWRRIQNKIPPELKHADPAMVPLLISSSTFHFLSPYWLHHPGKWFAYASLLSNKGLQLGVCSDWDRRLLGHRFKDLKHDLKMKDTLLGDAAEVSFILTSKPFSRFFEGKVRIGYHSERRIEFLQRKFSMIEVHANDKY